MKTICGIDPGITGALAFYDGTEMMIFDMPIIRDDKGRGHLDTSRIKQIILNDIPQSIYIEKMAPLPRVGGLQSFSMGMQQGFFMGLFEGLKLSYTQIRPSEWKKAMQCPADKTLSRKRANELMPQFAHNWDKKKDHNRAEAALIALYGFNK